MARIRCGSCRQIHGSVQEVRDCYDIVADAEAEMAQEEAARIAQENAEERARERAAEQRSLEWLAEDRYWDAQFADLEREQEEAAAWAGLDPRMSFADELRLQGRI